MAKKNYSSSVAKLNRKCKAMKAAMFCAEVIWLSASIFGWSFLSSRLHRAGGATTFLEIILLLSTFAVTAIIFFIAILIGFPFHDKIEQYRAELTV